MFNFRIINTADGNQIIDRKHTTSYEELTPLQMVEYVELEARLYHMDRIERNARKAADKKRKLAVSYTHLTLPTKLEV